MKIYTIIPNELYQSKKTHDELDAIETIRKLRISVVVNLWHSVDKAVIPHVKYYYHYPIPDGKTLNLIKLDKLADKILDHIHNSEIVLCHCYGGRNRSGLLNALIVRKLKGISGTEAREFIISKRPNALVNSHFSSVLESLGNCEVPKF